MISSKEILSLSEQTITKQKKRRVLIVDTHSDFLEKLFSGSDFNVLKASSDEQIIRKIHRYQPDVLIGDLMLPSMNAQKLCTKLKHDMFSRNLPIIIVSTKKDITHKIKTINGSADDYIVLPFDSDELLLRIERVIEKNEQILNANPLTRLPGNIAIKKSLQEKLANKETFATYFLDLDYFKAFNDYYGFERGDRAIELTTKTILNAIQKSKEKNIAHDFFIGHIGGDDFVIISPLEEVDILCKRIITSFDKKVQALYDEKDLKKGYIISKSRQGKTKKFPIMSISIAVVTNEKRTINHPVEISEIGTEIKTYLKSFPVSNYLKDRRI